MRCVCLKSHPVYTCYFSRGRKQCAAHVTHFRAKTQLWVYHEPTLVSFPSTRDVSVISRPISLHPCSSFSAIYYFPSENHIDCRLLILFFVIVFVRVFIATRSQRRSWPRRYRWVHWNTRTSGTRISNTGSYCVCIFLIFFFVFNHHCRELQCKQ